MEAGAVLSRLRRIEVMSIIFNDESAPLQMGSYVSLFDMWVESCPYLRQATLMKRDLRVQYVRDPRGGPTEWTVSETLAVRSARS